MPRSARLLPLLLLLIAAVWAGSLSAPPAPPDPPDGADLYRRTLPAVGWVHAADRGKGTGWVCDRPGRLFVTNYHVVGENATVEVFFPVRDGDRVLAEKSYYLQNRERLRQSGHLVRGKVLRRRPETDLALIELESLPAEAVALRLSAAPAQPGDRV